MLLYPQIDPVAVHLGPIKIHWYGLMYLLGMLIAWGLGLWRVRHYKLSWTSTQVSDFIFYAAVGMIVGGRLGYMLFYNTYQFFTAPWVTLKIWEGGMSFHGGLIGVMFALLLFAKKTKECPWDVLDFAVLLVPPGLACGRIGNFINGELWGKPTDAPWGMVFPHVDNLGRHPSQLYEFALEGIFLFIVLWWYAAKPRPRGCVAAVFLMMYAGCRIIIEFFREPDAHIGYLAFGWVSMGQILSIPMFIIGFYLWWAKRNENVLKTN